MYAADPYFLALGNALVAGTITQAEFDFRFDAHLADRKAAA